MTPSEFLLEFTAHRRVMVGYVIRKFRFRRDEAEDVVDVTQDSLLQTRGYERWRGEGAFRTFLVSCVRNQAGKRIRRDQQQRAPILSPQGPAPGVKSAPDREDEQARVKAALALAQLPPEVEQAARRIRLGGETRRAVAASMDITPSRLKTLLAPHEKRLDRLLSGHQVASAPPELLGVRAVSFDWRMAANIAFASTRPADAAVKADIRRWIEQDDWGRVALALDSGMAAAHLGVVPRPTRDAGSAEARAALLALMDASMRRIIEVGELDAVARAVEAEPRLLALPALHDFLGEAAEVAVGGVVIDAGAAVARNLAHDRLHRRQDGKRFVISESQYETASSSALDAIKRIVTAIARHALPDGWSVEFRPAASPGRKPNPVDLRREYEALLSALNRLGAVAVVRRKTEDRAAYLQRVAALVEEVDRLRGDIPDEPRITPSAAMQIAAKSLGRRAVSLPQLALQMLALYRNTTVTKVRGPVEYATSGAKMRRARHTAPVGQPAR